MFVYNPFTRMSNNLLLRVCEAVKKQHMEWMREQCLEDECKVFSKTFGIPLHGIWRDL